MHPSRPTYSAPLPDESLSVVSVEGIESRPSGLVAVRLRLKGGQLVTAVIPQRSVSIGYVSIAAAAIAQIALVQRGIS